MVLVAYSNAKLKISGILEDNNQHLRNQLVVAERNVTDLTKDIDVLLKSNSSLSTENGKLQQSIIDRDKERVELHTDLSKTIGDLQLKLRDANGKIAGHEVALQQEREVIKRKDIIIEDFNNKLNDANKKIQNHVDQIDLDAIFNDTAFVDSIASKENTRIDSLQTPTAKKVKVKTPTATKKDGKAVTVRKRSVVNPDAEVK